MRLRTTPRGRVSLARALSKLGAASRAEAARLVRAGSVAVDGEVVTDPSRRVDPDRASIQLDGVEVAREAPVYLVLHKPRGVVTTRSDPEGRATVYGLLPPATPWVSPVGRLDRDSSGLLLLTNDTRWAEGIASPASHVPKSYEALLDAPLGAEAARTLERGVLLGGRATLPCRVELAGGASRRVTVTLVEGRNRQVRRMLEAVGRKVKRLKRVRVGRLALGALPPGACRRLTPDEVEALRTGGR